MKKTCSFLSLVFICVLYFCSASFAVNVENWQPYPGFYGNYIGPLREPGVYPNSYIYTPNSYYYYPNMPRYEERILERGWHFDSKGRYYCKGDGSIFKNGWYLIDGKNYCFDAQGYVYRNQWIKNNTGSWYYVDVDGVLLTGWQHIDNIWYYLMPEAGSSYGVMARNTVLYINGGIFGSGLFAFNNEGVVIVNSWYGGHYYGPNGARQY